MNIKQLGIMTDYENCHTACESSGLSIIVDMTYQERYDMYMRQDKEKLASMLAERDELVAKHKLKE